MRRLALLALVVAGCTGPPSGTPRPGGPDSAGHASYIRFLCPPESVDECLKAYEAAEQTGVEAVLCIIPGGGWSIEELAGSGNAPMVGAPCGDAGTGTIRALINLEVDEPEVPPPGGYPAASAAPSRSPEP